MADTAARQENFKKDVKYPGWLKPLPWRGYSYNEYKTWNEDIRVELIYGVPCMMAAPDEWHQELVLEFGSQLKRQLRGRTCSAHIAHDKRMKNNS